MATQKQVAAHLDLSDRRIRQLIQEGVLPPAKGAKGLDLKTCRVAYIRYLRTLNEQSGGSVELQREKALESRERRRKLTRENDIADRKVIPYETVVDALQQVSKQAAVIFDSLPINIKRRVPQLKSKDVEYLKLEIARARNLFATMRIEGPEK